MECRVTDPSQRVQIIKEPGNRDACIEPITIPKMLYRSVQAYGDRNALMTKNQITKKWEGITFKKYQEKVEKIAKSFIKFGLKRHGSVAILASNCAEWFISELAAILAG